MFSRSKTLADYAKDWQTNAEKDALYVILCDPRYQGGKWPLEKFFQTGEEEIARVFSCMEKYFIKAPSGTFLDFGCGAGRLSKALQKRFKSGYGIDISETMITLANKYVDGVSFVKNDRDNLDFIDDSSIDFIYSHIVLHHIPGVYQEKYINEFCRILKPDGLAVFQTVDKLVDSVGSKIYKRRQHFKKIVPFLVRAKKYFFDRNILIEMHPFEYKNVEKICESKTCLIEAVFATNSIEYHEGEIEFYDKDEYEEKLKLSHQVRPEYLNYMYFVRKTNISS